MEAAATVAAEEIGYAADIGTIVLNSPPSSGTYAGDPEAVEVTVQENMPRWFTGLFSDGTVNVAGRAVARISEGQQTCVLALDESEDGAVHLHRLDQRHPDRLQRAFQLALRRLRGGYRELDCADSVRFGLGDGLRHRQY